jgi:hypothetical protein
MRARNYNNHSPHILFKGRQTGGEHILCFLVADVLDQTDGEVDQPLLVVLAVAGAVDGEGELRCRLGVVTVHRAHERGEDLPHRVGEALQHPGAELRLRPHLVDLDDLLDGEHAVLQDEGLARALVRSHQLQDELDGEL